MSEPSVDPRIAPATPRDAEFVRWLSREVFSRFGDYENLLPSLMPLPRMRTVIARDGNRSLGFAIYSLQDVPLGEVDLVAIAVEPARQAAGVGRALLGFVEQEARAVCGRGPATVRLTVAENNARARDLFERSGYARVPGQEGSYEGGQRSLNLRKRVR